MTVGGGAAGVEVTLAMRHRLRGLALAHGRDPDAYSFAVVTKGELLADHNASVRRRFRRILKRARRDVIAERDRVRVVVDGRVVCASGCRFPYDELIWVTEAGGAPWLAETGLQLDRAGFIVIDATLRSVTDPRVFAAGDVGLQPRPPAAQGRRVRRAPGPAARGELAAACSPDEPPLPFTPQREFLSLITTGDKYADRLARALGGRGSARVVAQGPDRPALDAPMAAAVSAPARSPSLAEERDGLHERVPDAPEERDADQSQAISAPKLMPPKPMPCEPRRYVGGAQQVLSIHFHQPVGMHGPDQRVADEADEQEADEDVHGAVVHQRARDAGCELRCRGCSR